MQKKCVLVAMFVTVFISAMDKPSPTEKNNDFSGPTYSKAIGDCIDERLLGVKHDVWFKSVRGTWASALEYAGCNGDEAQVRRRLVEIDSVVPEHCRNGTIFTGLQKNHWYVSYIVKDVIEKRVTQFKNVTGSQVDKLLSHTPVIDRDLSPQMNAWIHLQAKNKYMDDMGYCQDLTKVPFGRAEEDIHYTKLYGPGISSVKKIHVYLTENGDDYIQGLTENDGQLIWSVKDGNRCDRIPPHTAEHTCSMNECINTNYHLIALGVVHSACTYEIMRNLYSKEGYEGIVIFARPTFESYICQQAFKNSHNDTNKLQKLQKFVRITGLFSGFVKHNVLHKIFARLAEWDVGVKDVY